MLRQDEYYDQVNERIVSDWQKNGINATKNKIIEQTKILIFVVLIPEITGNIGILAFL